MAYPASVDVRTPDKVANWRPLVHWLLAIPHLIIASVLSWVSELVAVVSWFVVLFTGRLPEGLANFQVMALRYWMRAYTYVLFLHDQYPPFEFETTTDDPGNTPVTYWIHPQLENRNRVTVLFRIVMLIPALLFAAVVWIVAWICGVLGFFAVLFTGRWPAGLRAWVMKFLRVQTRLSAYAFLLTDDYPPFSTD